MGSRTTQRPPARRRFLKPTLAIAGWAAACLIGAAAASAEPTDYAGLQSDKYLGPVQELAAFADPKTFTEGPAVDRAGNVFFTNIPLSHIMKWNPQQGPLTVFRAKSNQTNGLYFDRDGTLLACEGGAARVTRTNLKTGEIKVLAEGYQGHRLAKPNDLCTDGHGRIYFTSRSAVEDPADENPKGVYRIDPSGQLTRLLVWPEVHMPNGIVTSPDHTKLYIIEAHPDADHHRDIRVYDLDDQGHISNGRVLIDFYPGRSGDGMCIDAEGNLYVAAGLHKTRGTSETLDTKPGIHVISPAGKLLAYRETPIDTITNCAFGGPDLKTLYVTCGQKFLSIRTIIPGKPAYRPEQ